MVYYYLIAIMDQDLCYIASTSWLNIYDDSLPTEENPTHDQKFFLEI